MDSGGEYTFASSYFNEENIANNQELQIQSEILPDTIDNFTLNFYKDNRLNPIFNQKLTLIN